MDEFPERFTAVKATADAAGLSLTKWPGVKVTPQDTDKLPELGVGTTNFKDRTGKTFNLGVIGAFLAMRNLLTDIARRAPPEEATVIFQDDVTIPADFSARLAAILPELPSDWDILFFSKMNIKAHKVSAHLLKLEKDMTAKKNWGNWGFLIKNRTIGQKLLPKLEHMLDVDDIQMMKFADSINMYLANPFLIELDQKTSTKSLISKLDNQ